MIALRTQTLVFTLCRIASLTALATLPAVAVQAQTVILQEDFSNPPWSSLPTSLTSSSQNGWIGNDGDTGITSEVMDYDGGQSLYISDNSTSASAKARYDLGENYDNGYIEFSVKDTGSSGVLYFYGYDTGSTSSSARNFILTINRSSEEISLISVVDGSSSTRSDNVSFADADYTDGDWNSVRIYFDDESKSAYVSINGSNISGLSVENENTNWRLGNFELVAGYSSGTGPSGHFDDIQVAVVPEPSGAALIGGALLVVAIGIRRIRR